MPYRFIASLPTPLLFSLPSTFKSMLNSIDNQPTYSEKSGLSRWCWQGAGFRGAGAHQLVDMPEKNQNRKIIILSQSLCSTTNPPLSATPLLNTLSINKICRVCCCFKVLN